MEARPPLTFDDLLPVLCRRERRLFTAPSLDSSSIEAFGVAGFEPRNDGAVGWFTGVADFFSGERLLLLLRFLMPLTNGAFDGEGTAVAKFVCCCRI